jgi:outer membrane lipoprotein LolB
MILHRAAFSLCAIGLLSLLGGCALLAPQDAGPRAESFDLLGRVLVSYDGRAFSSSVRWQHGVEQDEVWMMTPTGQTLAHLRENSSGATITGADQTQYHGSRVESLTRQALGWEFPLGRLQHWVRGAPVPGSAAENVQRDGESRITRMAQDGWRIAYEYSAATEYGALPRRVELTNDAQSTRLVIDSWRRDAKADDGGGPAISITR